MVPYCVQMRRALEKFANDATELLIKPDSIFSDIPIHLSGWECLYDSTDPEIDALTIICMQLFLKNHLILFERQAEMYLEGVSMPKQRKRKLLSGTVR